MPLGIMIALIVALAGMTALTYRVKSLEQKLEDTREITLIHVDEISRLKSEVRAVELRYKGVIDLFIEHKISETERKKIDIEPVNFL